MAEYLILVGLSGAGRSTAAATFEDRGWFVIDNLPPALIGKIAELTSQVGAEYERVCLVVGPGRLRGRSPSSPPRSASCARPGARVRVVFLDAPDEVLVRRYEGTRRRHPVEADERARRHPAGARDARRLARRGRRTSSTPASSNVHQLRDRLIELVDGGERRPGMQTAVVSFGFKHGHPARRRPRLRLPLPAEPALGRRRCGH